MKSSMKLDKRILTILLLGALVAGASWWFFARPASVKLEEVLAEKAAAEQQIAIMTQQKQQMAQGIDPLEQYYDVVEYADGLFPGPEDVRETRLAAALSSSASQRGMQDTSLDVLEPKEGGAAGLMVVPVVVSASGSYDNVLGWLDELKDNGGLRTVEGVTLSGGEGDAYQVSFTLNVWYSTTPDLQPAN